jgi:hypothetical protein
LIGRYNTIAVGSMDPDISRRRFEFPISANELVETFLSRGTLSAGLPSRSQSWLERFFADTMDWLHQPRSSEGTELVAENDRLAPDAAQQRVDFPYWPLIERPPNRDTVIPKTTFRSVLECATNHQLSAIVSAEGAIVCGRFSKFG